MQHGATPEHSSSNSQPPPAAAQRRPTLRNQESVERGRLFGVGYDRALHGVLRNAPFQEVTSNLIPHPGCISNAQMCLVNEGNALCLRGLSLSPSLSLSLSGVKRITSQCVVSQLIHRDPVSSSRAHTAPLCPAHSTMQPSMRYIMTASHVLQQMGLRVMGWLKRHSRHLGRHLVRCCICRSFE